MPSPARKRAGRWRGIVDLNVVGLPSTENGPRHARVALYAPWHFLYFLPLPQGHGSLRPTLSLLMTCLLRALEPSPPTICSSAISFSFLRWMLRVKSCMVD